VSEELRSSEKIPGRLWDNIPAKFTTKNTLNTNGDSSYRVRADYLGRYAPVNTVRHPEQVLVTSNRHICYVDEEATSILTKEKKDTGHNRILECNFVIEKNVIITVGNGNKITVSLQPHIGLRTYDFVYSEDKESKFEKIHRGHQINRFINKDNTYAYADDDVC